MNSVHPLGPLDTGNLVVICLLSKNHPRNSKLMENTPFPSGYRATANGSRNGRVPGNFNHFLICYSTNFLKFKMMDYFLATWTITLVECHGWHNIDEMVEKLDITVLIRFGVVLIGFTQTYTGQNIVLSNGVDPVLFRGEFFENSPLLEVSQRKVVRKSVDSELVISKSVIIPPLLDGLVLEKEEERIIGMWLFNEIMT